MAPRKSTGEDKGMSVAVTTSTRQTRSMDRQTRSQTQRRGGGGNSSSSKLMKFESPEKKRKRKTKAKEAGAATKKMKKEKEEAVEEEDDAVAAEQDGEEEDSEIKRIVIEHCKQHKSFKERANEVKDGLEKAVPGIIVTLNADKPRRGCFEIREEDGEPFISLLDMKKPFKPMMELDMEVVIGNIVEKIK